MQVLALSPDQINALLIGEREAIQQLVREHKIQMPYATDQVVLSTEKPVHRSFIPTMSLCLPIKSLLIHATVVHQNQCLSESFWHVKELFSLYAFPALCFLCSHRLSGIRSLHVHTHIPNSHPRSVLAIFEIHLIIVKSLSRTGCIVGLR